MDVEYPAKAVCADEEMSMMYHGYWNELNRRLADPIEWNTVLVCAAAALAVLAVSLLTALFEIRNYTARIYNWNGSRYCYLGRARLLRISGGYQMRIGERMADLSYTTLYQICPSKRFVRRNRYMDMALCAGNAQCLLHVDDCMRQSIYYR